MSAIPDPLEVLGLGADASIEDVQEARRRLAKSLHPDVGGDAARMQAVNAAADAALARLGAATATGPTTASTVDPTSSAAASSGNDPMAAPSGWWGAQHDAPSFTVEALPVETFEALLVVASWLGEVVDDDPPYVLELRLHDPGPCWCRLEVVPDAGASTVSVTVVAEVDHRAPSVEAVRDRWIEGLNQLSWDDPDRPLHG
jgi:hypothetical protein